MVALLNETLKFSQFGYGLINKHFFCVYVLVRDKNEKKDFFCFIDRTINHIQHVTIKFIKAA